MSEKEFDLLVFVGRFQPPHFGHLAVIEEALRRSKHLLILVGSANRSRSMRDPFSFEEREGMLRAAIGECKTNNMLIDDFPLNQCTIAPLNDHLYNDAAWIEEVQSSVEQMLSYMIGDKKRVGIIGHSKDHTSYYLGVFPNYECVNVDGFCNDEIGLLNSTDIRRALYQVLLGVHGRHDWKNRELEGLLPKAMIEHLVYALESPDMDAVIEDVRFVHAYRKQWKDAPFPPTFNTVDAVVQSCGHILMVLRGQRPGAGKFALPGGFIGQYEPLLDACVRELIEETQIAVSREVLLGSLRRREARTFDDPHRSSRGRTITHAYRFDLAGKVLPEVRGGDDAASAMWVPISKVNPKQCFEDHAFIIRSMLGVS